MLRQGKKQGFVELKFEINNKEFVIHRALKRTKTSVVQDHGFMIIDDMRQDMTAVELKSKILDLLGYPKELLTKSKSLVYRYTVYTPQEQMKQIILEDSESRLNILRHIFSVDKYKRIKNNLSIFVTNLKGNSKVLQGDRSGA